MLFYAQRENDNEDIYENLQCLKYRKNDSKCLLGHGFMIKEGALHLVEFCVSETDTFQIKAFDNFGFLRMNNVTD